MPEASKVHFEASAYLQTLLGRELFRSEDFAIVELVKNAYDSGASEVEVFINPARLKQPGEIVISDNGSGMNQADFERLFMIAGYSERPDQVRRKRVPTGEKGVGRFAADRLGKDLEVFTRTRPDEDILQLTIDWTRFGNRKKRFSEITADLRSVRQRPRELGPVGTVLRIGRLRNVWETAELESVRRALEQLLDPFSPPENFRLVLTVDRSPGLSGEIRPAGVANADLEVRFSVGAGGEVRRRWLGSHAPEGSDRDRGRTAEALAGLKGRFLYFLKRPKANQVNRLAPGVRLYRDGFRFEPFGHPRADWLGVEEKRAKRAGHAHIVPSRLFGFVSIQRKAHPELRDTTSREALIDTPASRALIGFLRDELRRVEDNIRTKVSEPRWRESTRQKAQELERARLLTLSILSFGLAHELRQPLQVIRSEAGNIRDRLGELGLQDVHLSESQAAIDENVRRIDENIKFLTTISSGDLEQAEEIDLADVVRRECDLFARRCAAQGFELIAELPQAQRAVLNQSTVAMVLANLVTNAMQALERTAADREKRIAIGLQLQGKVNVITVSDTGDGIPEVLRAKIFKRFATGRTGGLGIGLYYCKSIVEAQEGSITFTSSSGLGTQFTVRLPNRGQ